jgi:lipopolysaccharide export system permease protein
MTILTRYLLRQHAPPFVFALSALTAMMLLQQIARRLQDLIGKGLPWTVVAEFFALTIPFIVAMTLSMAVLVAVLYTVSRLSTDHEITAMRAGGVSLGQIMRPLLAAGAAIALVAFLFGDQLLPRTNHRLRSLMTDIYRTKPTFSLKEHVINEVQQDRLALRAAQIDPATYRMRDVTLYDLGLRDGKRIVYAESGALAFAPNQEDLYLTLYDGEVHEFDRTDLRIFQLVEFERQVIRIRGVASEFARRDDDTYRGDREMGVCQLEDVVLSARRETRLAERQADVQQENGLRAMVGLAPVEPDTALAAPRRSMYCRALQAVAGFLLPADLRAQGAQDSTARAAVRRIDEAPRPAFVTGRPPRQTFGEARLLRDRARNARIREAVYLVEWHKKYAIPAACVVFVLVAVPVALRFPRGGVGLTVGVSLVVFAIYYIGLIAGESLANRLVIPPFWAMWSSNMLLAAAGLVMVWWVQREGTVARRREPARGLGQRVRRWFSLEPARTT